MIVAVLPFPPERPASSSSDNSDNFVLKALSNSLSVTMNPALAAISTALTGVVAAWIDCLAQR